ncbi:HPF/RaiA family ribosome-associated protein [Pedobacter arcticus]|uniref:HPF/RaiA family ribosome-associated protein n=1 Tax=Pedobacter arcticus TaxID=752140 RepID=UPI0002F9A392|nr:HPF/RaiA family ribosome-associated protein [Pedobacter arcticus]
MIIQINTDNHIEGKEELNTYITNLFNEKLQRFDSYLTRVEVHLSDENGGEKGGADDKKCNIEARLENLEPIFASSQSDDISKAIHDCLQKIKRGIEHQLDKVKN